MRQVKTSLEIAGKQRIKTTNSLFKTTEELEHLESIGKNDSQTFQILDRERVRAAKFDASAERSRRKLLRSRTKLAVLVNRNRALTRLRHQIQQERDQKKVPPSLTKALVNNEKPKYSSLHAIELKY